MLVQYSSNIAYYEGGAKNPLNGTHKVSYKCAGRQACVFLGNKKLGKYIMAYILIFPIFAYYLTYIAIYSVACFE